MALARAVLVDLKPEEARAISTALQPVLARIAALPDRCAEEAPDDLQHSARPPLRADVPGPALPVKVALAGVPASTPEGLVQAGRFAGRDPEPQ